MDSHDFLSNVLPDNGWYCLLAINGKNKKQKLYDSIGSAVYAARNFNKNGYDTYFALSSFKDDSNRTVDNVLHTQALFLDIDCGEDKAKNNKGYATKGTAINALQKFVRDTGLPSPTVVDSGRGLHVYWALTEPVPYNEWFPAAERLKRLTVDEGLICDPAVTSDAARVLRVPQTNNYKDNPPNPVKVLTDVVKLHDFDVLTNLIGDVTPVPTIFKPSEKMKALIKSDANLTGYDENYENSMKLIVDKTIAGEGCSQLGLILTHQAEVDEPLWRAGLSIAKFCKNGDTIAHEISAKHPDYNKGETVKKLEGIAGPYLCDKFDSINPHICTKCQHWGNIRSPIVLGRRFAEAPVAPVLAVGWDAEPTSTQLTVDGRPRCPWPFKWGAKGAGVYMEVEDNGESTTMLIYDHDFYVRERINDPMGSGESIVFVLVLPYDGVREFTVPLEKLQNPTEMRKSLAREGVISPHAWGHIESYVTKSVIQLQLERKAVDVNRQFGWTDDRQSFILGDRIFHAHREPTHNFPLKTTKHLFKALAGKGNIDQWSYMANCYAGTGMESRQMIVGMGFGTALMDMIDNVACCGFHIHSKGSGIGKTSCLDAAISVWGEPEVLRLKTKDTDNGRMKRTAMYKSILACTDEITNLSGENLSDLVYALSSGQEKIRLNRDSEEMAVGGPWSLIAITTANTSILERIAMDKSNPNAEAQRVMECFFGRVPRPDVNEDKFNHALVNNHGVAGPIFIQYVLDNYKEIKEALYKWRVKVIKRFRLTSENRFWSAGLACILLGVIIANKLGLVNYNMEKLSNYIGTVIEQNQLNVINQAESIEQIIGRYIATNLNGMVNVSNNKTDALTGFSSQQKIYGNVVGRWEKDTNTLMLEQSYFKKWLSEEQIGAKETIGLIMDKYDSEMCRCTLTKGTDLPTIRVTSLLINNYSGD